MIKMKPPLIRGWDFELSEYEEAWKKGRLLTGQIETSNKCNLLCEYCFRDEAGSDAKKSLANELDTDESLKIITDMVDLGAQTINIIGAGEPTIDFRLPGLLERISMSGAIPVVFTNGYKLRESLLQKFDETGTSIVVKVNSFDPETQDNIVNRQGYAAKRDITLHNLMEAEFNHPNITRLGIDCVVSKHNIDEVLKIHRYCRENNIMPMIKTFIPAGRTKHRTDMEISMHEFLELSKQARDIDAKEYGIIYERLIPFLGGVPCPQNSQASMYVTILGDIFECPAQQTSYGNTRAVSIRSAFEKIKQQQKNPGLSCPPRIKYWKMQKD